MREQFQHFLKWFLEILVPYAFLLIGFLIMKTGRGQDKFEKAFDIGYDSCILGFGMAAVLLGGSEFEAILETKNGAIVPVVIGVITIAVLFVLDRSSYTEPTKAKVSIIIGTLVFGANTAMVTWLNEAKVTPTIFWGIASWAVPCGLFLTILHKLTPTPTKA